MRVKAFCEGALHSVEEDEASDSTVNLGGTFRFGKAAAYVLQSDHSVSYSTINSLCSKSKSPFKGISLTVVHMCDINEDEVSPKHTYHEEFSSVCMCLSINTNMPRVHSIA